MNKCPENQEFDFVFEGKCPITTCQHCTSATKNGCLYLDRAEAADRTITNREIKFYKQGMFSEFRTMDQKTLDSEVRKAQMRAKSAICLQSYINWLYEHHEPETPYLRKYAIVHDVHRYLSQTFELYSGWMIYHMSNVEQFAEIAASLGGSDVTLGQALGRLTPKKYEAFCLALDALKLNVDSEREDNTHDQQTSIGTETASDAG